MRLIIGLLLATSISFACDNPNEEIGGYKVGCPFEASEKYTLINEDKYMDAQEYQGDTSGLFDIVVIGVINGNIEAVKFRRNDDRNVSQHEIDSMVSSLTKRWGKPTEKDPVLSNVYYWNLENSIIENIVFSSSEAESAAPFFSAIYISEKANTALEEAAQAGQKELDKEFSKF